jgi:hypothetical protein
MPELELARDFSKWLGIQMVPAPNDPNFFRSEPQDGIILTEEGTPESHRGKRARKVFWSVSIRVEDYHATGNDFDRSAARGEAEAKFKELVGPLIEKFGRLGFLTPN